MRERLAKAFPLLIAALLPFAGAALAVLRYGQGDRPQAAATLVAALLGAVIWAVVFSL